MYFFFNNKFYETNTSVITAESKAFRYGELVFETMRFRNGSIQFWDAHYQRLITAAKVLHFQFPKLVTQPILQKQIESLLQKNRLHNARVRLTVFKGNGGLFENDEQAFNILIETYNLQHEDYMLNENGLDLCVYRDLKKQYDILSAYKTGNHLLYNLAAHFAKQQKTNEAIVLNANDNIADTTISNLFIIKNEQIITPPITDGGVAGIMRQYLISNNQNIIQQSITIDELYAADAVFLTNSIKGIQWVKRINEVSYNLNGIGEIFNAFRQSL